MTEVRPADLDDPLFAMFIADHLADMAPTAPAESRHALALDELRRPGIRVWEVREAGRVVGSVALAPLDAGGEELKSMRTDPALRGRGIGAAMLTHALDDARSRGVTEVLLETGSMEFFAPARALYRRFGFVDCRPFGSYRDDPNSTYLRLPL